MLALKDLHAGLFVGASDQIAWRVEDRSLDVPLASVLKLGLEVWGGAVELADAAVGFAVSRVQVAPDGGSRPRLVGVAVDPFGGERILANCNVCCSPSQWRARPGTKRMPRA